MKPKIVVLLRDHTSIEFQHGSCPTPDSPTEQIETSITRRNHRSIEKAD